MSKQCGYVYLLGAGPGDPDLLTIKGKNALQQANVVIYDRLISESILGYARKDCELLHVGKAPGQHSLSQEEITALLVQKALDGKVVVRLKGGDPFVFGRGGEEALALGEQDIPFEVIPGVTSAISVPAFAGIPVTHRGISSSFMVITGHEYPQKNTSSIAWEHVAQSRSTLVFLMGMNNLPHITENLLRDGLDAKTPVAIIEKGGSPQQRTITGTLDTIEDLARSKEFRNPAVIIVGSVVQLRNKIQWFEKRPLFGLRIMVTRAQHQASKLSAALATSGATVQEVPIISFVAPSHPEHLGHTMKELGLYDWLVFTSVNSVDFFFDELFAQDLDARNLAGLKLAAIGPATQAALEDKGLRNIMVPDTFCAEGLIELLQEQTHGGERLLLPRAEQARDILPRTLRERGVLVEEVAAYKTVLPELDRDALRTALLMGDYDIVTFTSSSTVHNLIAALNGDITLLAGVSLCSLGPITSSTIKSYGLNPSVQAETYTIEGMVEALIHAFQEQEN